MSTSYPILITKQNLVPNSLNSYTYNFSKNVNMDDIDIAVSNASIWFSWQNITQVKSNNQFSIIHPTTAGTTTLNLTIPDGGYNITDLNNFLRYSLINQGYYIQNNTTNEQVVYAELKVNSSIYAIEFVSYPMPTSLPVGYTAGSSITFPISTQGPQLVVSQFNFGVIIGYELGTYPAIAPIILTTETSSKTPVVSDTTNVVITLDSCENSFAPNSKIIHSISPAGYQYASLIKNEPNTLSWVPQQSGWRQSINIQLLNQDMLPLNQVDTDITITLLLRNRDNKLIR